MDQEKFDKARQLKELMHHYVQRIDEITTLCQYNIVRTIKIHTFNSAIPLSGFTQQQILELLQAELVFVQGELDQLQAEFDQL